MKKLLSFLLICVMLIFITPTSVFAKPENNPPEIQAVIDKYWPYQDEYTATKIGDWYYDEGLSFLLGYDGPDTDITLPYELNGKKLSYTRIVIIPNTVKTIRITEHTTSLNDTGWWYTYGAEDISSDFFYFNEGSLFEEFIVDEKNSVLKSVDGVLISKKEKAIMQYPPAKKDEEYTIPKDIENIYDFTFAQARYLKKVTITENVSNIREGAFPLILDELYFKNGILGENHITKDDWREHYETGKYTQHPPEVPNGTIYCIEGSPMHEYYKVLEPASDYYKELKTIPNETPPAKPTIKSVSYSSSKKAMRITLKKQKCDGFKIYRTFGATGEYEYVGFTTSDTFYDEGVKKDENCKYKASAYDTVKNMTLESELSKAKAIPKKSSNKLNSQKEATLSETVSSSEETPSTETKQDEKPTNAENKPTKQNIIWILIIAAVVVCGGAATGVVLFVKRKR